MKRQERPVRCSRTVKKDAGAFIGSILGAYTPEKDFELKNIKNPVVTFYEKITRKPGRGASEREIKALAREQQSLVMRARVLEVNRLGVLRSRVINNGLEFREAMTAAKKGAHVLEKIVESGVKFQSEKKLGAERIAELRKLADSKAFREDYGADSNDNTYDEYIPIMGGPWSHQQYLHDFLDAQAKTFEASNHNPYAHFIVWIKTCFILGRGVSFKAHDTEVQSRFAKWWKEQEMDSRLESWSDTLTRDGELVIRKFRNPATGAFFLRWLSPSTIWEYVSDIEDTENIFYAHQQYPAAYQVLYGAPNGAQFNPNKYESSRYIINQIPADDLYIMKINVGPDEKRGRSDLFNILSWLKRHKDHQTGVVLKAIVQSVFAWKNKLTGTNTDVNDYISQFGTDVPDFGSIHVENEASTLTPMTADSSSGGNVQEAPSLLHAIAVGSGLSIEYFGGSGAGKSGGSNRAAAVVGTEPSVKGFQRRQLAFGRLLGKIAEDWAANENFPSGTDTAIDFEFPEIAIEDRSAKIKDLQAGLQDEVISHEAFSVSVAKELGKHDYSYEDEQGRIAQDKESGRGVADLYFTPGADNLQQTVAGKLAGQPAQPGAAPEEPALKPAGMTGQERRTIKRNDRQ